MTTITTAEIVLVIYLNNFCIVTYEKISEEGCDSVS